MQLLDGKLVAADTLDKVQHEVKKMKEANINPKLVVILVGDDPASKVYVGSKEKRCKEVGIVSEKISMPETTTTEEIIAKVNELNEDASVSGILVQLPLPKHIEEPLVIRAIDPNKDVDGFGAYNIGKMFLSKDFEVLVPCTPKGIIKILDYYDIELEGMNAVVIGRSNIVGKPMATMMLNRSATVTTCHSRTKDLKKHTLNADLVVAAVGKPKFLTADMIKNEAVVVDVGIHRIDGKLVGDVDFDDVKEKASYMTPVPGGVGPMTVACLMENVVLAAKKQNNLIG